MTLSSAIDTKRDEIRSKVQCVAQAVFEDHESVPKESISLNHGKLYVMKLDHDTGIELSVWVSDEIFPNSQESSSLGPADGEHVEEALDRISSIASEAVEHQLGERGNETEWQYGGFHPPSQVFNYSIYLDNI